MIEIVLRINLEIIKCLEILMIEGERHFGIITVKFDVVYLLKWEGMESEEGGSDIEKIFDLVKRGNIKSEFSCIFPRFKVYKLRLWLGIKGEARGFSWIDEKLIGLLVFMLIIIDSLLMFVEDFLVGRAICFVEL